MSARRKRPLKWGETPWDSMPQEQLLRETQRLYAACVSMRGALAVTKCNDPASPYWGPGGTGGHALAMGEQALAPYQNEPAYRSFFRYAVDLLFDGLGAGWKVCDGCDVMLGARIEEPTPEPRPCPTCGEPMRPLAWADMKPRKRARS